jgi:2-hydroxy-3-keto-5-methylthiopentenyl-1-phosphate phosphatase
MALVRTEPAAMDAVIDAIGIDQGLAALLTVCATAGAPVFVVSDGFDYCIERLLRSVSVEARPLAEAMPICASHLEPAAGGHWRTAFPFPAAICAHGCATCKPALMRQHTPAGHAMVFVGDGLSDRYAAGVADLVFAKDGLAEYCAVQNISHVPFTGLTDVAIQLNERLTSGLLRGAGADAPLSA